MATPAEAFQSKNAAPLDPLVRLRDGGRLPSNKISDSIKKKFQDYWNRDSGAWRELINVGTQVEMFISGKQFPFRNPLNGGFTTLPLTGFSNSNTQKAALNFCQNLEMNLQSKWAGSNPDILVRPGRNIDSCSIAAKGGQVVWNYYNRKYYNTWYNRQECRLGMTFGTYINDIYYDDSAYSMSVLQDIFGTKNVQMGEGIGYCSSCDFMGKASDFKQNMEGVQNFGGNVGVCPECGEMAQVDQPESGEMQGVTGQEEIRKGDLVCKQLPLPSVRFDLMKRAEESSWFISRQEITRGAITRVLGNVKIPGEPGNVEGSSLDGTSVVRALAFSGQSLGGFSGYGNFSDISKAMKDKVSFDEMWLSADDISDINLQGGEKTVSGETLPEGKLSDIFPDGLCAVGLNGMAVILGLYSEKHRGHISSGVWFVKALSGAGRGLVDSVEVQKQFNRFANQSATYFDTIATPAIGVDSQILPPGKARYIGTSNLNIPFDLTKLPEGRTMKDALWQFQAAPLPNAMIQYYQQFLNVMAQKTSNVTDYNQGEPGITAKNTTATAAEIDQSNADSVNISIFQGKAEVRKSNAEITLSLYPKYFPMKRFLHIAGKFGEQQGMEFYGSDLEADLICEVITNSEMPKGPYTQRKNLMTLFQITQGGLGYTQLKQADPKLATNLLQTFDVDIEDDNFEDVADLCRKRLDMMKQAASVGVSDPIALIGSIQPPIDEAEPHLHEKAQWFSEILDSDEMQAAEMPLRLACSLLAKGQLAGATQQQTALAGAQGMAAAAMQAPTALGQAHLDQQQQPQEEQQITPDAALASQDEAANRQTDAQDAEAQRQHEADLQAGEKEMHTANLASKEKIAKMKEEGKIKIAKLKPKPQPSKPNGR